MKIKDNKTNYFKYFKNLVGWNIYGYLIINCLVGLLDGIGLAMFIPLLGIASNSIDYQNPDKTGNLNHIVIFFQKSGFDLNLTNVLLLMIMIFIGKGILSFFRNIYFARIRLSTISKLRLGLIQHLQRLSYSGFTKMEIGRIQNTMIGELGRLVGALTNYFSTAQHLIMVSTYIFLAVLSNWQFAILVAIGGGISNFAYKYINRYTKRKSMEISSQMNDFNGFLIQALHNFKYLKATGYFKQYSKNLTQNIQEQEEVNFQLGKINAIAENAREPIIIIIISAVIIFQTSYLDNAFTSILASLLLFYRGLSHLVSMQGSWNSFLSNTAGLHSFEYLLTELKEYQEPESTNKIKQVNDIKIDKINLAFDKQKVINNISFTIKKNTSVAFVGESGAGKTTLANIIAGLQSVDSGNIIIDNTSLYEADLNSFRKHIGYITQESVIFDDTLFNNITFWDKKNEENLNRFHQIIDKVNLTNFLNDLPAKEDSPLGNNGILVSGGQKQRISIARELYKDIQLLVMDEATSALDSETERQIKDSIDLLQGKVTLIIIAHRLSTIKDVDIIYLLDKGTIVASGNFQELYQSSEKFRKMVNLQEIKQ